LQAAAPPAFAALLPTQGTGAGQAIVNLVRNEVGVAEEPPGSNDGARIAQYRQATAGSGVGPWCAYFTSWAAREAGVPLGDAGQGLGRVDDVWAWAERSGKAIPAAGATPQAGDLIVWGEHIGIVESVGADGTVGTIVGNSSDSVARRTYGAGAGGAIGYVRLG
ncbi:MAG: CHAP domain-containing protein, partial [Solirubrobacteraceae bacterium]